MLIPLEGCIPFSSTAISQFKSTVFINSFNLHRKKRKISNRSSVKCYCILLWHELPKALWKNAVWRKPEQTFFWSTHTIQVTGFCARAAHVHLSSRKPICSLIWLEENNKKPTGKSLTVVATSSEACQRAKLASPTTCCTAYIQMNCNCILGLEWLPTNCLWHTQSVKIPHRQSRRFCLCPL